MTQANGKRNGFTLVELLVVVGMIAVLIGSMTASVTAARHRARVQKATSDVKVISQAILAYENYKSGGYDLPTMTDAEANRDNLNFLLGSKADVPVLLEAALSTKGMILDPWGHPYRVSIKKSAASLRVSTATGNLKAGYSLPNCYRISEGER